MKNVGNRQLKKICFFSKNRRFRGNAILKAYSQRGDRNNSNYSENNNYSKNNKDNKQACFECHSTDHFIRNCPLVTTKNRNCDDEPEPSERSKRSKKHHHHSEKRFEFPIGIINVFFLIVCSKGYSVERGEKVQSFITRLIN